MTWQLEVPSCFGDVDKEFARHESDERRARQVIDSAKAQGATRDDFEKEMVWYLHRNLTSRPLLGAHIDEQIKRLNKLWE